MPAPRFSYPLFSFPREIIRMLRALLVYTDQVSDWLDDHETRITNLEP